MTAAAAAAHVTGKAIKPPPEISVRCDTFISLVAALPFFAVKLGHGAELLQDDPSDNFDGVVATDTTNNLEHEVWPNSGFSVASLAFVTVFALCRWMLYCMWTSQKTERLQRTPRQFTHQK